MHVPSFLGINGPINAVVVGGSGGLGAAFVSHILHTRSDSTVVATGRDPTWLSEQADPRCARHRLDLTDENSIHELSQRLHNDLWQPNVIINATGLLHDGALQPERTWRHLSAAHMQQTFAVNAFGPALLCKHFLPLLPRGERAIFASLSARVGSIGDNRLGGWYAYRASKAAHNMMLKTAAIEARRQRPLMVVAALHPGTVDSALSKPFQRNVPKNKLFRASDSARMLCDVLTGLSPADSGGFFAYDGSRIEW